MKSLTDHLHEYLNARRKLGFQLYFAERVLKRFTEFADEANQQILTTSLLLEWKTNYGNANNETWSNRLGMIRPFAAYLSGIDPSHEIPPLGFFRHKPQKKTPYIYSETEIGLIVNAALNLKSPCCMRGIAYHTIFGLIAATGLRVSEALNLTMSGVDLENNILRLKSGKSGKERVVPLSESTSDALKRYISERDRLTRQSNLHFFRQVNGSKYTPCAARYNFAKVSKTVGIRDPQQFGKHGVGPRIHDLRHTFAVHTIRDWLIKGFNPDDKLYMLSSILGHEKPNGTYWYIESTPELLTLSMENMIAAHVS